MTFCFDWSSKHHCLAIHNSKKSHSTRDHGLVVWFSLWVREAVGSIPTGPLRFFIPKQNNPNLFFSHFTHNASVRAMQKSDRLFLTHKTATPNNCYSVSWTVFQTTCFQSSRQFIPCACFCWSIYSLWWLVLMFTNILSYPVSIIIILGPK